VKRREFFNGKNMEIGKFVGGVISFVDTKRGWKRGERQSSTLRTEKKRV